VEARPPSGLQMIRVDVLAIISDIRAAARFGAGRHDRRPLRLGLHDSPVRDSCEQNLRNFSGEARVLCCMGFWPPWSACSEPGSDTDAVILVSCFRARMDQSSRWSNLPIDFPARKAIAGNVSLLLIARPCTHKSGGVLRLKQCLLCPYSNRLRAAAQ
jgi:hypothetical protein